MRAWIVTGLLFAFAVIGLAQEPATQIGAGAEIRLLRAQVAHQQQTIEAQQAEITALRAKLDSAGLSTEGTRPAVSPDQAKRVVVAIGPDGGISIHAGIRSAVSELKPHQWFNVISSEYATGGYVAVPAFPTMRQATDSYREEAAGKFRVGSDPRASILGALRFRPEVILYIGQAPSDEVIAEIEQANRGINARIYTTIGPANNEYSIHLLWKLAHVTGGECIDQTGKAIEAPSLPIAIPAPVKPVATQPSPFRMR